MNKNFFAYIWLFGLHWLLFSIDCKLLHCQNYWIAQSNIIASFADQESYHRFLSKQLPLNCHWFKGSLFLYCKHNYAGKNLTTQRSWSNEKFNVANNAFYTWTPISYLKGIISITQVCWVSRTIFFIFSNHSNITILLLVLFLLQHKSSLHIFLGLYFCVFIFLCFCV